MNDPANPSALPPSSPADGDVPKPSGRVRLFTPIESAPARPVKPRGRLAPGAGWLDAEDIEAAHGPAPSPLTALPASSGSGRPILVPNAAIPFLQEVHALSNPERVERRISTATRTLAVAALVAAVGLVIASSFQFRAPSVTAPAVALPAALRPTAPPLPTAEDNATAVREALALLDSFLHARTDDLRREATGSDDPLPASLSNPTDPAALARTDVPAEQARLLHAGSLKIVLVPVIDGAGLPRTAAVVHRGDRWRVDWRSLVTPESAAWPSLANGTTLRPSPFRVLVSRRPDGAWSLERPGAQPPNLTATAAPGSRVAAELEAALAARDGQPLSADLFLTADSSRSLNIVGWTPDKWSF